MQNAANHLFKRRSLVLEKNKDHLVTIRFSTLVFIAEGALAPYSLTKERSRPYFHVYRLKAHKSSEDKTVVFIREWILYSSPTRFSKYSDVNFFFLAVPSL